MEFFIDKAGEPQPIPDVVVSASTHRELVAEYVEASTDGERAVIVAHATELLAPAAAAAEAAPEVPAAPDAAPSIEPDAPHDQ